MSEFQYVGFRALDAPLTDSQLAYMQKQSSRAEITRWSFDNVYHYGDFRGNTTEMLRRGYDLHLHYANFGIRRVMIRLPHGLPLPKKQAAPYLDGDRVAWRADGKGPAGILTIEAVTDPGALDELWDVEDYLDRLAGVRQQLIDGDPRPLYVAWLSGCQSDAVDPETATEPPLPAGLGEVSAATAALAEFFALPAFVLEAAAERSPSRPQAADHAAALTAWLESINAATLHQWLLKFLTDEPLAAKAACLQAFHKARKTATWPVTNSARTFAQLLVRAEELADAARVREAKRQARARRQRLADMARSPQKYLDQVDRHVAGRGREHYEQAAQLLSELREAVGGDQGDKLARQYAAKLKQKHPTLKMLSGALRRHGLLA